MPSHPAAPSLLLHLATQSFLAGILVALALLAVLAYRSLRDRLLSLAGLFGLTISAAWITFSGIADTLFPASFTNTIHTSSLILGGLSLVIWERVASGLLNESPSTRPVTRLRRALAWTSLSAALAASIPSGPSHHITEALLGGMASLLAVLTLTAGLRARREGLATAGALVSASVALLVCCATLWAWTVGWTSAVLSLTILQLALVVLAMALGWAMLSRMTELRKSTEVAQAAQLIQVELQAHELERLVDLRNAELSQRLKELNDARNSTESANQGLQRALDQLEQVASIDRLTGAWNRRRFEEAVLPEIALAHRRRDPLALLMFDLDHFKRVNDTFGHSAGDAVLAGVSQTVRMHLRASDSLVRWGGEEFLVMAPATHLDGAMGLAEKLRDAVASIPFPGVGHVTMSLGVAEYALGESLAEWIDRADQALYRAKAEGRNRSMAAPAPDRTGIEPSSQRSLLELIWEDTYASGHALIDAQHQRLFHLASALMAVLTEHRPLNDVALRLETLLAHTAQHFHDEEKLLRESNYSDLPEHAAIHAGLLTKARSLQANVQAGQLDFGKLVTFLALDLIKGHILTEDQGYFSHLSATTHPDRTPLAGA
jgi:diguanylate cyclase (GGDEF)-like protein/hemerythrin-like metal-binding protein